MSNTEVVGQISVTVGEWAIGKFSRFFNGTDPDVLRELLQNAHRGGATRVDITIDEGGGAVEVSDNGEGIADPASLLAFGRSDWSDPTVSDDDPAGMGVFALARRQVSITSRRPGEWAWTVDLTPEHFAGEASATVRSVEDDPFEGGVRVRFSVEAPSIVPRDVKAAALHYPVRVFLNGEPVRQVPFLEHAVVVEQWEGVAIGVYRRRSTTDYDLNFHGATVAVGLPRVLADDGDWSARVDVRRGAGIELVLPARKEVVETPFMAGLREAAQLAIFRAMAVADPPVRVSAEVWLKARAAGVNLPEAVAALRSWRPMRADEHVMAAAMQPRLPVEEGAIVVGTWLSAAESQVLWRAAEQAGIADRLVDRDREMAGYPWYDRLTRLVGLETMVTLGGEQIVYSGEHGGPESERPERIEVRLQTREYDTEGSLPLATDIAVPPEYETDDITWVDEINVAIAQDATLTVAELASFFEAAFFSPSDDFGESDSYDTQQEAYEIAAIQHAVRYLATEDDALERVVQEAVRRAVVTYVPVNRRVLIRIGPDWSVRVRALPESPRADLEDEEPERETS